MASEDSIKIHEILSLIFNGFFRDCSEILSEQEFLGYSRDSSRLKVPRFPPKLNDSIRILGVVFDYSFFRIEFLDFLDSWHSK